MAYESEFYIPENIVGFTGDIRCKPTVYFKKNGTFGCIKQQNYTDSQDTSNCGRDLVMTDPTHSTGSVIAEGIERHTESIQGTQILIAKTTFKPVNRANRARLAESIENQKHLEENKKSAYYRAVTSYIYGKQPAPPDQTAADFFKNKAAWLHLYNSNLANPQNREAMRNELDGLGLTPSNVPPIPLVVPSVDHLPLAKAKAPQGKLIKMIRSIFSKKSQTTTGILIPDLVGNRFHNHGVSANLPPVEIVAPNNYTAEEKKTEEDALQHSQPRDKNKTEIKGTVNALQKLDNENGQSNQEGVTSIPPFRPQSQVNPELETPAPPQEMDALTRAQNPSVLGTRSRANEAPPARRTRRRTR